MIMMLINYWRNIKMSKPRYLTKSRFTLALDCPTKLFYTQKKDEYPDSKMEDQFLEALAEGGYQVGALAKCYHPDGHDIKKGGYDGPLQETNNLMQKENVTIFEAAFLYDNLFIRADILVKKGNTIDLIEVKSKSFAEKDETGFLNKSEFLDSGWAPYLYDVAFQKYVLLNLFPGYTIRSYLMLADKNAKASIDGLNQKFMIKEKEDGYLDVSLSGDTSLSALGDPILRTIRVDGIVGRIFDGTHLKNPPNTSFEVLIQTYSDAYKNDEKIYPILGSKCRDCEFQSDSGKSGFKECWKQAALFTDEDFYKPLTLHLWGAYMGNRKDQFIKGEKYFLEDLERTDISPNEKAHLKSGMSHVDRKMLQIEKAVNQSNETYFDKAGFADEKREFVFPLHFIDFETSAVAIPFTKGRKPYEGVAFQYSHHIMYEDGKVEHKGQYLNSERGVFPNFDFARALKKELADDDGTIFRWAPHENTYMNIIYNQLMEYNTDEIPDKDGLCDFIKLISHSKKDSVEFWKGDRDMVDLWDFEKKYYYSPIAGGSNSIKDVLPAVLQESIFLQNKYNKAIYGKTNQIKSLNFDNMAWIQYDSAGKPEDPYKLLPPLFEGIDEEQLKGYITDLKLADGGAAMTAYAKMQFSEMSAEEKNRVEKGLLRYCELDTLAMVMIYEHWNSLK